MFGVAVELKPYTLEIDRSIAAALAEQQYFSGEEHLIEKVHAATQSPELELIEIDLRSEPYWWSTRLYLQAKLIQDFSTVKRLVFVQSDRDRRYVGMVSVHALTAALATKMPELPRVYESVRRGPGGGQNGDDGDEITRIVYAWTVGDFDGTSEDEFQSLIGADELRQLLGSELETAHVEWPGIEDDALRRRILETPSSYAAITDQGSLRIVVNAAAFARRVAMAALQARA